MAKTIDKMEFFRNAEGKLRFNETCKKCQKKCKQSFRVDLIVYPLYERKHKC